MLGTITKLSKASIVGFGVVGKSTAAAWKVERYVDVDDDGKLIYSSRDDDQLKLDNKSNEELFWDSSIFILCVPTPTVGGKQDLSTLKWWVRRIVLKAQTRPLIVVRSTILPGTMDKLEQKYGDEADFAHVPEFLNEKTAIQDAMKPEILLIGSNNLFVREELGALLENIVGKKPILCTSPEAELAKYALNGFFGLKVIFGNHLWDVAREIGADYDLIAKILTKHKWGSKNGWKIWKDGYRGYGGKCLPKDIEAFGKKFNLGLLKTAHRINKKLVAETIPDGRKTS